MAHWGLREGVRARLLRGRSRGARADFCLTRSGAGGGRMRSLPTGGAATSGAATAGRGHGYPVVRSCLRRSARLPASGKRQPLRPARGCRARLPSQASASRCASRSSTAAASREQSRAWPSASFSGPRYGPGSRIAASHPRQKWIKDFDFDANPNINPATIHTATTITWRPRRQLRLRHPAAAR